MIKTLLNTNKNMISTLENKNLMNTFENLDSIKSREKFNFALPLLKKIASYSDIAYKHAAALIHNDRIFSYGYNTFVPFKKINNIQIYKTIHAELSVFKHFPKKCVKGLDILVIRVNKQCSLRNSRPCDHCIEYLQRIGIRKVYYSTDCGQIVCEFVNKMIKKHISASAKIN